VDYINYWNFIKFLERKRRRWDQQAQGDETPAKKKSGWDQADVCVVFTKFISNFHH
jgi:hypothetical protein